MQIMGDGYYRTSRFFFRSAARDSLAFALAFCFLSTDSGTSMEDLEGTLHLLVLRDSVDEIDVRAAGHCAGS